MSDKLNSRTLERLRKEAKRWLRALQNAEEAARDRFARVGLGLDRAPTLRDVQLALARENGFAGWAELKAGVGSASPEDASSDRIAEWFLDNACPDHHVRGAAAHIRARATAARILAQYPEVKRHDFYTTLVCGDLEGITSALAGEPALATRRSGAASETRSGSAGDDWLMELGPKGWEPILYLCFTRLDLPAAGEHAEGLLRVLLAHGADPNVYFMAGGSRYTPLVGVMGEGEENRPAHPQRDVLVRLLLDAGADPFDMQVFYNIHFHGSLLPYLELIYEHTTRLGRADVWADPEWNMIGMGGFGAGARFLLNVAIEHNDVDLAAWCLAHGASPDPLTPQVQKKKRPPQASVYERAFRAGALEIAQLLVEYGAPRIDVDLTPVQRFTNAALMLDEADVVALAAAHPEVLTSPEAMFVAASRDRQDVVRLLLNAGVSKEVQNEHGQRALHVAAYCNAPGVARLLIERGAEIDPYNAEWGNTPLGAAAYARNAAMIDLLAPMSKDIWEVMGAGKLERLRELLAADPTRARVASGGSTLLMWLPQGDEQLAIAIASLLMEHGADASARNPDGLTAADKAERAAMFDLAQLLRDGAVPSEALATYEQKASALLDAYRLGTADAMERHWKLTWHRRAWPAMRSYVLADLGRAPMREGEAVDISIDDARWLIAREHGYPDWNALLDEVSAASPDAVVSERPLRVRARVNDDGREFSSHNWTRVFAALRSTPDVALESEGAMTDSIAAEVATISNVTALRFTGSAEFTDEGLREISRLKSLRTLDMSGTNISDAGMMAVRELAALEEISVAMTHVSDVGVAELSHCDRLTRVDLSWTSTGNGALRALAGLPALRQLFSGNDVTDEGLTALHGYPAFITPFSDKSPMQFFSTDAGPNHLTLRGPLTDHGMRQLRGLNGLFGLSIPDDAHSALTPKSLVPLIDLPRLGRLSCDANDESMEYIAQMPALRFLSCQDTNASDAGFEALSKSRTIEHIWGRRCHNLRHRGFVALSRMPALRGLSVSCKNVDDAAIATLPDFPMLRELMPMDIPDEGYRHIAKCEKLEVLTLMYCRDTTDRATEHIVLLPALRKYFASYTQITDRTAELLSSMHSLESITFDGCAGLTDSGIAHLAKLPRLRELRISGQNLTSDVLQFFGPEVHVRFSL